MLAQAAVAVAAMSAPCKRLVVISGCGSRGVGFGVARQVLAKDATAEVVVMARSLERASAVASELGARAHAVQCDVTDDASCAAAAARLPDDKAAYGKRHEDASPSYSDRVTFGVTCVPRQGYP